MLIKFTAPKISTLIKAICVFGLCIAVLTFSDKCSSGALKGLDFCIKILIPSLFPFMALSSFISSSGITEHTGKITEKIMNNIFGLPASFAPIILLSVIGGYPIGAKGISLLYNKNPANEFYCKKAALFAVCAGPGFIINYIGASLYSNHQLGFVILISQILSVVIIGIAINIINSKKENLQPKNNYIKSKHSDLSTLIVKSAVDSSRGIFNICTFVVLFSAFTGIINSVMNEGIIKNSILCLLEVCTACEALSNNGTIEAVAFAIGFGGLCVHFQIYSLLTEIKINKVLFFSVRILQGGITALLTHILIVLFPQSKAVFSTSSVESVKTYSNNFISVIALIAVAICFLYSIKDFKQIKRR